MLDALAILPHIPPPVTQNVRKRLKSRMRVECRIQNEKIVRRWRRGKFHIQNPHKLGLLAYVWGCEKRIRSDRMRFLCVK